MRLASLLALPAFSYTAARAASTKDPMLQLHNNARVMAGMDKLAWSADLAEDASRYAKECIPFHDAALATTVAENLYWASPFATAQQAFAAWNDEVRDLREDGSCTDVCDHYLRITDPTMLSVGCGEAVCWGTYTLHVCRYSKTDSCKKLCRFETSEENFVECKRRCKNNLPTRIISVLPEIAPATNHAP